MYLVNTKTLQLETFTSENDVRYAILSHRWQEEEVLYEDMQGLASCTKRGVSKLRAFCKLAQDLEYNYAWIDTCCIDKKSSAELAEAINSMYRYYQCAGICIAYLSDVDCHVVHDPVFETSFASSVWFTRCWTLQELLAPRNLSFYSSSWRLIGTKLHLKHLIATATHISMRALEGISLATYSVAQRMSWASNRQATRIEDTAYSLMGLFDVNMPMLYGEGYRAFTRLQEEILRYSDDETIFAWTKSDSRSHYSGGLFATSPADFRHCMLMESTRLYDREEPLKLTNRGIAGSLVMAHPKNSNDPYMAFLNASRKDRWSGEEQFVGIFLQPVTSRVPTCDYVRVVKKPSSHLWFGSLVQTSTGRNSMFQVRVRHRGQGSQKEPDYVHGLNIRSLFKIAPEPSIINILNESRTNILRYWLHDARLILNGSGTAVIISVRRKSVGRLFEAVVKEDSQNLVFIQLGLSSENLPTCLIIDNYPSKQGRPPSLTVNLRRSATAIWTPWAAEDTSWMYNCDVVCGVSHITAVSDELFSNIFAFKIDTKLHERELEGRLCVRAELHPHPPNDDARLVINFTPDDEKPHQKLWTFEIERASKMLQPSPKTD